jgi:hypothetical protein
MLRFLGIILRVIRLEVSVYNVYITNQLQTTFVREVGGERGVKSVVEATVRSKEEHSQDFCPNNVHEFGLWLYARYSRKKLASIKKTGSILFVPDGLLKALYAVQGNRMPSGS